MDELRVRAYNVRFGDAILVTVPDRDAATGKTTTRHILIDVGNVLNKEGGADTVFKPVLDDVIKELGGRAARSVRHDPRAPRSRPGTLLLRDQGLCRRRARAEAEGGLRVADRVGGQELLRHAPAGPEAEEGLLSTPTPRIRLHLAAAPPDVATRFESCWPTTTPPRPGRAWSTCAGSPGRRRPTCTAGRRLTGTHPFKEAKFKIWAPEEDTSRLLPRPAPGRGVGLAPVTAAGTHRDRAGASAPAFRRRRRGVLQPGGDAAARVRRQPAGHRPSRQQHQRGLRLQWRGWKLLFPGDAELASWKMMKAQGVLEPVHFLKVSHHGSHNGTPDGDVLEAFLPLKAPDKKARRAPDLDLARYLFRHSPHAHQPEAQGPLRPDQHARQGHGALRAVVLQGLSPAHGLSFRRASGGTTARWTGNTITRSSPMSWSTMNSTIPQWMSVSVHSGATALR